ncbi:hypothetical protein F5B22DRAFT_622331 [Xylaria bambusicola]|uniref:uncharacterized protein n=1 Tax=Xylaria bambusicola TaxID=326684 RepID=UPI002007D863|nr:uncharacterized protein F5B22DRAFT_622331 [Xylaria bambusicola]KAI0506864.1 hypothetical protein F5B22DRAFT_622331 [Xylaria bambusicola]
MDSLDCLVPPLILFIIPQYMVQLINAICLATTQMPTITLHSKFASPTTLSMALTELVGDFEVQLRQNVYYISSTKDISRDELIRTCERMRMRSITSTS